MYSFISGNRIESGENHVVIENNGIGYFINASVQTILRAEQAENPLSLYVHMQVREDDISLYGFYDKAEKEMFCRLTEVSGVGAKIAMQILCMPLDSLALAIISEDIKSLSKLKGVGKKTAERIVLELKDKVSSEDYSGIRTDGTDSNAEAIEALAALGFTRSEAVKVLSGIDGSLSIERKITLALQKLSK